MYLQKFKLEIFKNVKRKEKKTFYKKEKDK